MVEGVSTRPPVLIVVAVEPVLLQAKPGPEERLRPDVEALPVAAGNEHAVRHGRALPPRPASPGPPVLELGQVVRRFGPAPVDVPRREAEEDVRGPVVRDDAVGVELADPAGGVADPFRVRPAHEVSRRRGLDVPLAWDFLDKVPVVRAVLAAHLVPEDEVLRVEEAVRDDALVRHLGPVDAVGRLVGY